MVLEVDPRRVPGGTVEANGRVVGRHVVAVVLELHLAADADHPQVAQHAPGVRGAVADPEGAVVHRQQEVLLVAAVDDKSLLRHARPSSGEN